MDQLNELRIDPKSMFNYLLPNSDNILNAIYIVLVIILLLQVIPIIVSSVLLTKIKTAITAAASGGNPVLAAQIKENMENAEAAASAPDGAVMNPAGFPSQEYSSNLKTAGVGPSFAQQMKNSKSGAMLGTFGMDGFQNLFSNSTLTGAL